MSERAKLSLFAIDFFQRNMGRVLFALEECEVDGYEVKHPSGQLHGTADDPWIITHGGARIGHFYTEANATGVRFRFKAEDGWTRVVEAFEILAQQEGTDEPGDNVTGDQQILPPPKPKQKPYSQN